ncbi:MULTISPECIES: preprotein translocase subunit SecG [unclassified Agarivorans]|uniref:preprotein translocase subunit SecG n=1 Tax=unclassified Agarivorans TaxID=2636026 RepID=UPI0010D4AA09|nr:MULTISPECIES: preprotein translocase subunit SecG [unclassified Agarivorans]MDO6684255.1 preprotein translocase subunit SecG [Agarivorans sp. 3_MG-2023]MDO6714011.1 preprotein translocase subunit SecG [Agarivorans sp. 2_MG-2023]MDO6762746.1 preprotein translocase subunit SecG [Agarivorans sp. 1_MG-2023]GDY28329.1 preprotein translocase subunit SecG [Agarivorans sp. Toyoura001]
MYEILLVVYLVVALTLIGLVLIQQGKGADMGASFGSGASNTVFGSSGSGNFLTRATAIFATLFIVISLVLGNLSAKQTQQVDEWGDLSQPAAEQVIQDGDVPVSPASPGSDVPN